MYVVLVDIENNHVVVIVVVLVLFVVFIIIFVAVVQCTFFTLSTRDAFEQRRLIRKVKSQ